MDWIGREILFRDNYISSRLVENKGELHKLQRRMTDFYTRAPYPSEVRALTSNWQEGLHKVQIALCGLIPPNSRVLEVGCGNGSGGQELKSRIDSIDYVGCDISSKEWSNRNDLVLSSADTLAFPSESMDVVLSMYVIEHLVFPAKFLDECWRVLQPGGRLLIVAPDFNYNGMASERMGLTYGSGREKLRRLRFFDALFTAYDSRLRIPRRRLRRRQLVGQAVYEFPVLSHPRCLRLRGFVPDCDAIYPANPDEIVGYISQQYCGAKANLFYHDPFTFGLLVVKQTA